MFNRDQNRLGFVVTMRPARANRTPNQLASEFDIETPDCTYTRTLSQQTYGS